MKFALDKAAQLRLAQDWGILFLGEQGRPLELKAMDHEIGFDAQPQLVTAANSGILSLFTTYVDPKIIEVLIQPMKAAELYGEKKIGDWVTDTAAFPVVERTGVSTAYGDYAEGGVSGANVNWPMRQSLHYQVFTRWGQRELERAGKAQIDWANQTNMASVLTLNKFQNKSYLFGISGLQNFGGVNDPSLPAGIVATTNWFTAAADVIYTDFLRLVQQMVAQGNGLVDSDTPYRCGISPGNYTNFNKTNIYNVNVFDQIKKNFNVTFVTVPEFSTAGSGGTELVQLIAESVEGQRTVDCAFTEKMRAHAMITLDSSWRQKKSQGTWGTIFYQPVFVAALHF